MPMTPRTRGLVDGGITAVGITAFAVGTGGLVADYTGAAYPVLTAGGLGLMAVGIIRTVLYIRAALRKAGSTPPPVPIAPMQPQGFPVVLHAKRDHVHGTTSATATHQRTSRWPLDPQLADVIPWDDPRIRSVEAPGLVRSNEARSDIGLTSRWLLNQREK